MAELAVVGPGLAGSLLALALARRGIATTLLGPTTAAATSLSYGAMAGRAAARSWHQLERHHGPLGWRRSWLLLHGWPAPLPQLPVALQALATAAVPLSRVDAVALASRLPAALAAAGVRRQEAAVQRLEPAASGWRLRLDEGEPLEVPQVVLAAGAGCRALWPDLPPRLRFSWAGVIELEAAALDPAAVQPGWLRHARRGGIVQPLRWQRPALEARAGRLEGEAWIVDAGLAPWGETVLLGQISLVGPDLDPLHPPDPAWMEQRLREGLGRLDPRLATLAGHYRQVPVPFCDDGQPLAEAVAGHQGLWVFSGFSGAFSTLPERAERLAAELAASLAGSRPVQRG